MFFYERGEIMANEAINHVVQVERTIAKIRQDAEEKIQQINAAKQEEITRIEAEFQNELKAFKKQKEQEYKEDLNQKVEANKQSIRSVADSYNERHTLKQEELSNYIVKEVLNRYGS